MNFSDFVKNLQNKPEHIRNRIFWVSSFVAAVLVVSLWAINFKHTIQNIDGRSVLGALTTIQSQAAANHYLALDGAEMKSGKLLVYFSVNNDSDDILNFSAPSDIALNLDGNTYNPVSIQTRQNQPFTQKILSHTQTFGILTFDSPKSTSGDLTFDNLNFDQSPANIFHETIGFDLTNLSKPQSIRN